MVARRPEHRRAERFSDVTLMDRARVAGTYDRPVGFTACTGSRYVRTYCNKCCQPIRVSEARCAFPCLCDECDGPTTNARDTQHEYRAPMVSATGGEW